MTFWRGFWAGGLGAVGLIAVGALLAAKPLVRLLTGRVVTRLMTDKYPENLFEMFAQTVGHQPRVLVETGLRAQEGKRISRPLGTPKRFPHFDDLMFIPAQLATLPTGENEYVNTETVIGPKAKKPLKLAIPLLVSGMAYGLSLTGDAKVALARGAAGAGTATNSGEGGFYPPEREAAQFFIQQYTRGGWPSLEDTQVWKKVDAIEIQAGQGAQAGSPQMTKAKKLGEEQWRALGLPDGSDALLHSRFPDVEKPEDFKPLVERLRALGGGVPVGIKLAAGHNIEQDLAVAVDAGVDFVTIDGAQGASHAAEPILQDDFGLPTLYALCRAARFLEERGLEDRISLIVSGGLMTPGEFLKALALGATACSMGTACVMAIVHTQATKVLPFDPPTSLVLHDGKHRDKFDPAEGAKDLTHWFWAATDELVTATRALGLSDVHQVGKEHLCALSLDLAQITGVQPAWQPPGARPEVRPIMPFGPRPEPPEPQPPAPGIRLPVPEEEPLVARPHAEPRGHSEAGYH